jgi:hypothetical protein
MRARVKDVLVRRSTVGFDEYRLHLAAMDTKEPNQAHLEFAMSKPEYHNPTGTVTLLEEGEVILIPTPSPDPRGINLYLDLCASLADCVRSTQPPYYPEMGNRCSPWNV